MRILESRQHVRKSNHRRFARAIRMGTDRTNQKKASPSQLKLANQIDVVCDEFEQALLAGKQARIESMLDSVSQSEREVLFRELLRIEIDYRLRNGKSSNHSDFENRFPMYRDLIAEVVREFATDDTHVLQSLGTNEDKLP